MGLIDLIEVSRMIAVIDLMDVIEINLVADSHIHFKQSQVKITSTYYRSCPERNCWTAACWAATYSGQ